MTRNEVIAHLESEIQLLLRARDILETPLAVFMKAAPRKVKARPAEKIRKQPEVAVAPATPPAAPAAPEPLVHRVPPKRRMERRQLAEKPGRSAAALSGHVPTGPVAVSANEARKMQQERIVAVPPPQPAVELRPEPVNERSLGSLIQAFERRAGLTGLEIP